MRAIRLQDVSDPFFQAKFWKQVTSKGLCWVWRGTKSSRGYGLVSVRGELMRAHRVSYVMAYGSISVDKLACHTCDNPACVNPLHIYEGTDKDNVADCIARGRRSGHHHGNGKKLSALQVETARRRYADRSANQLDLAREYGVARSTMQRVLRGQKYANEPGPVSAPRYVRSKAKRR